MASICCRSLKSLLRSSCSSQPATTTASHRRISLWSGSTAWSGSVRLRGEWEGFGAVLVPQQVPPLISSDSSSCPMLPSLLCLPYTWWQHRELKPSSLPSQLWAVM